MKSILTRLSLLPGKTDLKSWALSFILINFAFLYHTLNFMWGNHDVKFIKQELLLSSGLFEGRFTQFIPYRLLTLGQILPILNNLLGFAFLTLALWLLAKYWNIKKSLLSYTLFITFFATEPYTLSWLYFTLITISCLLWAFFAVLGLYLSALISQSKKKLPLSIAAILCFFIPLGGYPPVINTFFVCLSAKLVFSYLFENKDIKTLLTIHKYTLLNIIIAAILFKISLLIINPDNVYNLETITAKDIPARLASTIKIAFSQFFITVPFMERGYKITLALMSFCAVIGALLSTDTLRKRLFLSLLIFATIWATSLTTFISIPATEFVSRIDFYGYAFLYLFFLAILLNLSAPIGQSLAIAFMLLLIPLNIINDYRALKVWQQGFDAEFQILDRITERIENHLDFNPNRRYRFYQAGDIAARPSYYNKTYDKDDVFLLSLPYLAMWQGQNLMEFYSPFSYIDHSTPLLPTDITPEVYDFFIHKARPWPHENAVYLNNDIIIIILNEAGLWEFQQKLRQLYPKS